MFSRCNKKRIVQCAGFLMAGFVFGVFSILTVQYVRSSLPHGEDILPYGRFADIRVTAFLTESEREALLLRKGNYVFMLVAKEESGEIEEFDIRDGIERQLVSGTFEGDSLSTITVFNNSQDLVFSMRSSGEQGIWQLAHYGRWDGVSKKFMAPDQSNIWPRWHHAD